MGNIFLFRHGEALNPDSDYEKLSWDGFNQAENAGEKISEIMNERWRLFRQKKISPEEFGGLLKAHSGVPRTTNFLEQMLERVNNEFKQIPLSLYGESIEISSPDIYKNGREKIIEISNFCFPIARTQLIVGHNPGIAKTANYYVKEKGFEFQGDEDFLNAIPEGKGYWINTTDKTVKTIYQ